MLLHRHMDTGMLYGPTKLNLHFVLLFWFGLVWFWVKFPWKKPYGLPRNRKAAADVQTSCPQGFEHAMAKESCWFSRPALDIPKCLQDPSTIQPVGQALLCYRYHLYFQYAMNNNNEKAEFNKWDITCNLFHFYLLCMPVVFLNVFAVLNQILKKSDLTNNY